jgi:hypothetical protein
MARNITDKCRLRKLLADNATALTSWKQRICLIAQKAGNTGVCYAIVTSSVIRNWCYTCSKNTQVCSLYASTMANVLKSSKQRQTSLNIY